MRPFFLFVTVAGVLLGAVRPAWAQSGGTTTHGIIKWGGYGEVFYTGGRKQKVPVYTDAAPLYNDQVGWFVQRLSTAATQGAFTSLQYEPFAATDAKLFDASKLPAGPEPELVTGIEAKQPVTFLRLRPVRRNPQTGQPERLVAFDYQFTPNSGGVAARGTATTRFHAAHSVLNAGNIYKMGVAESGIYKLDKTALSNMGVSLTGLNPKNLHLYGNSMGILPQPNATWRPDDLVENSISMVNDNGDNVFDDNEYFLFYSPGAHTWTAQGGVFRHRNNIYTDTTYYFVKVDATAGKRVTPAAPVAATSTTANLTTFTYRDFHEHDLANLLKSGRSWVGEGFRVGSQQSFSFGNIPDLVATSPVRVTSNVLASGSYASTFQFTLNGAPLGSASVPALTIGDFTAIAKMESSTMALAVNAGTDLRVGLAFSSGDPGASGYLDYLEINAERLLRLSGAQLEFRSLANIGVGATNRFTFGSLPTGSVVWDVTNPRRAMAQTITNNSFIATSDTVREYVAFQPTGSFGTPRSFGRVANQDLHAYNGNANTPLDLIIVTYPHFRAQAQRLADYRTQHNNLRTAVVTTTEVYNEFGSGGQDVTAIRDFMKLLYDRDNRPSSNQNLALLLFGDASYDYKSDAYNDKAIEKQIGWWADRVPFKSGNGSDFDEINQNYVPTYESRESFNPYWEGAPSYSSDDYFTLLDDNEGEWSENGANELMDIGVGRLPVRTPKGSPADATQAQQMVDKIISYDASAAFGKWRNRITLVADDGEGSLFVNNSIGSDGVANMVQAGSPVYNIHKVYLDLYPQVAVAAGQRSPEANRAIDQSIEQGSLIVNYLGHGGPKGWADEQIVTNASLMALRNPNNLTFLMTGTCDFSTYDNPDFTSAGEQSLTDNTTGGAVGLFTTTRVVAADRNAGLNSAFYNRVLQPINGKMPTIGNVVMFSKNDYLVGGTNNRNYTLLADPSMTLAYPRQTVVLDSVRERNATNNGWDNTTTLKALARIRLHGRVLNNGTPNPGFTGRAQVTIYDKPTNVRTLGNEVNANPADSARAVTVQESVVYAGQANVVNGEFNLTFVVAKDINYNVGMGKISLYAFDAGHSIDANGYELRSVGGASQNAPKDTIPPLINLFMDNRSFVFGGLTAQNSTLLADLSDDNGINTSGAGIGHDITVILDNDPNKLVVLNESYVSNVGDFRAGSVNNLFKDLATGPHSLRLKAWDTYNNSSEKEIEFMVAHDEKLALDHVLNYPNPFANSTTFLFDHNQAGNVPDNLDVQVQIFTVAGHLVRTINATVSTTEAHQHSITWNGRDEYDDQLARGVYVYRLSVRSQHNGTIASKYEKLVILN